ncbi:class E sortase [Streptomyces sp. NPDC007346]|uniref:class E sortase n=1 Tax=Streptomyces sp. NPDC007346 TaxID=3154682 RepID=UPI00345522A7
MPDPLNGPLTDPLNGPLPDPLNGPPPGQHASPWFRSEAPQGAPAADRQSAAPAEGPRPPAYGGPEQPQGAPSEWYDPEGYQRDWYGPQQPSAPSPAAVPVGEGAAPVPPVDETIGLRTADTRRTVAAGEHAPGPRPRREIPAEQPQRPEQPERSQRPEQSEQSHLPDPSDPSHPSHLSDPSDPVTGGRAERRRAAKGRGRRRTGPASAPAAATPAAPLSRVEARRAAKAAKDSPAVVASRAVGEIFISLGVLMLLFVTYQLWWTNVRAEQIAGKEANKIQEEWANGAGKPGVFAPGQGFAIMHIPKLDVVVPIAEGINKEKVLDRGMLGHYGEGKLKTAMPEDEQGNFAVAGHRNTHGEPFRYVNKLSPGDPIVVETRDAYYTYEMTSILPQTSPSNISVIEPIPVGSGFTEPGRYITLTTCTPEFTSTYRLIVWGKMVDERPRGEGKPKALVG